MGDEEMLQIRDLDVALLQQHRQRLWFYFADRDNWVGKQRHHILSNFKPDIGSLRITLGEPFIPHAFCISTCLAFFKVRVNAYQPFTQIMEKRWPDSATNGFWR